MGHQILYLAQQGSGDRRSGWQNSASAHRGPSESRCNERRVGPSGQSIHRHDHPISDEMPWAISRGHGHAV